jgi:heme/copper-type cytochrome/quinol oxidase subunit 2
MLILVIVLLLVLVIVTGVIGFNLGFVEGYQFKEKEEDDKRRANNSI